jgi:hypothetical protein
MKTPLRTIEIVSIYPTNKKDKVPLPARMAFCTPDAFNGIQSIDKELRKLGGRLVLSDLFRSYEMQLQSHNDYESGRKTAFSPPPGGSLHECGRGMDIDLKSIKISLKDFWVIALKHGFSPIIDFPKSSADEAWHFDCRGSHQVVYDYYRNRNGVNFKPYKAMAVSAILAIDVHVDNFGPRQKQAQLQAGIIRLGRIIGNIDGYVGRNTQRGIEELGIAFRPNDIDAMLLDVENLLQDKFPSEYLIL